MRWLGLIPCLLSWGCTTRSPLMAPGPADLASKPLDLATPPRVLAFDAARSLEVGGQPVGLTVVDANRDGRRDLMVAAHKDGGFALVLNTPGGFQVKQQKAGSNPVALVAADYTGDMIPDVALADETDLTLAIWAGHGDGTFALLTTVQTSSDPSALATADFDGDGKLDIALCYWVGFGSANLDLFTGAGNGTFLAVPRLNAGGYPSAMVVGDFDRDGHLDLAAVSAQRSALTLLTGYASNKFQSTADYGAGMGATAVAIGDLDGNGQLDAITANSLSQNVSVLLANGVGTLGPAHPFSTGRAPFGVAAADFDGDGRVDLAVADSQDQDVSILLGNGDGTFEDAAMTLPVGANPRGLVAVDLDGDGMMDLAVANMDDGTLSILMNRSH